MFLIKSDGVRKITYPVAFIIFLFYQFVFPHKQPQLVVDNKARSSSNWVVLIVLLFKSRNKSEIKTRLFEFIFTSLTINFAIFLFYASNILKMLFYWFVKIYVQLLLLYKGG